MKNFCVLKMYKDSVSCGSIVFNTNNKEDAFLYAALMDRNCDEGYHHVVLCTCEK